MIVKLHWRRIHFDEAKAKIKQELHDVEQAQGSDARLKHILDRVNRLADSTESMDLVTRFVLVISALIHHQRTGGLSRQSIRDLTQIAKSILQIGKITPGESLLSFLHGELHNALSLIDFEEGDFYSSAWQLAMAHELSRPSSIGGEAYEEFSLATRMARVGAGRIATEYVRKALTIGLPPREVGIAYTLLVKLARLGREFDRIPELKSEAARHVQPGDDALDEIEFQATAAQCAKEQDLFPLIRLIKKDTPHYTASKLLQLRLWALAMPSERWLDQIPPTVRIRSRKGIKMEGHELFGRITERIDKAYDDDYPPATKLQRLEEAIEWAKQVPAIDKELLILAAVANYLRRSDRPRFADQVEFRYKILSLGLSEGTSSDVLGVASKKA